MGGVLRFLVEDRGLINAGLYLCLFTDGGVPRRGRVCAACRGAGCGHPPGPQDFRLVSAGSQASEDLCISFRVLCEAK